MRFNDKESGLITLTLNALDEDQAIEITDQFAKNNSEVFKYRHISKINLYADEDLIKEYIIKRDFEGDSNGQK